jgi:hypothetical protein
MAKINQLFIFSLLSLILLSSCGKYEEGPSISLTSKENRLARKWELTKVEYFNGENSTYSEGTVYPFYLNFNKNGILTYTKLVNQSDLQEFTSTWTWHLGTWGVTLDLTNNINGNNGIRNYQIKRLTKKELFIYDRATGHNYYFKSE